MAEQRLTGLPGAPGMAAGRARVLHAVHAESGVVPDAVRFCFDLVTTGTSLDGAVLEIDEPRGRVVCRRCAVEFDTDEVLALCPCGSADVELLQGRELRIRSVEVAA